MAIVKTSDFVGEFQIPTDKYSVDELDTYITRYETKFINRLLGCDLAALFIADLDPNGVPQTPKYEDLYNEFCKQDGCYFAESAGMKEMLIGMIYFEMVKNNNTYVSLAGNKQTEGENSEIAGSIVHNLYARWNLSVKTSRAIQWFIEQDMSIYPEYEGVQFKYNNWV